jgi:hypothetical protein
LFPGGRELGIALGEVTLAQLADGEALGPGGEQVAAADREVGEGGA